MTRGFTFVTAVAIAAGALLCAAAPDAFARAVVHREPASPGPLPPQLWWTSGDGVHRALQSTDATALVAPVSVPVPMTAASPDIAQASGPSTVRRPAAAFALPSTASAVDPSVHLRVPLGSVWKLFVYAYLQDRGAKEPAYRCATAAPAADDEYCCHPGGEIGRDAALSQSCGPYFAPARLHVDLGDWQRFWRACQAPAWLSTSAAFDPGTEVEVVSLLRALAVVPEPDRQAARAALLSLSLRLDAVVPELGAGPRFKTWSWHQGGARVGGAAGWLADGTPFWFGAPGTSKTALHAHAAWIASRLDAAGLLDVPPDAATFASQPCVAVALFRRYPVVAVTRADGRPAAPGTITGPWRVAFANGNTLAIDASPGLQLRAEPASGGSPRFSLEGRWPLEDYVARVVDREADATQAQAARALAVAARTFVLQNATLDEGCRRIADDSHDQRVSPNPPTRAARDAASFTQGLVLDGPPVRYHRDKSADGQMSWQAAVAASRVGTPFPTILAAAYPESTLRSLDLAADCPPLPEARRWLLDAQRRWRDPLRRQAGFEPLPETLQVCRLAMGVPNSDQRSLQIRVREWLSQDGRVTLVHEYLHLAFRHHPNGQSEDFVERLARQLVDS